MAIQQLVDVFIFVWEENNKIAPQKAQLVFSHVSLLLLFVLLTRWDIFSENERRRRRVHWRLLT